MSLPFALKPTHRAVTGYYTVLAQLANVGAKHETAVREAWHNLIETVAGPRHWTLVREYAISRKGAASLRLDGALLDEYRLVHGCLEAKDDADDLADEMRAKLKLGYPSKNTLFWQPRRALLMQNGKVVLDVAIDTKPEQLVEVLALFFAYVEPAHDDWERASTEFRDRVAELGGSLATLCTSYESQKEFKLMHVEAKGVKPDWRVDRMKLAKDKTELVYNDWLTLAGIPAEVSDYRLGNRSALKWVIDQYRVERSKENPDDISSDPNRADDEEYIVRLVGQVVTVSVETVKLVKSLPLLE